MRRALVLVLLLLGVAVVVWFVTTTDRAPPASEIGRDEAREIPSGPLEMPPTLIGLPAPSRPESDRAFPDLPPNEVPDGAGVIEPEARDVAAPLRHQRADTADLDGDGREVREAAERVGGDDDAALGKGAALRGFDQVGVADPRDQVLGVVLRQPVALDLKGQTCSHADSR